jgi:hypothetical protein
LNQGWKWLHYINAPIQNVKILQVRRKSSVNDQHILKEIFKIQVGKCVPKSIFVEHNNMHDVIRHCISLVSRSILDLSILLLAIYTLIYRPLLN